MSVGAVGGKRHLACLVDLRLAVSHTSQGVGHPVVERGQLGAVAASQKVEVVTAEQMERARLRAENARLKMARDIVKKAAAYFAQDVLQSTLGSGK